MVRAAMVVGMVLWLTACGHDEPPTPTTHSTTTDTSVTLAPSDTPDSSVITKPPRHSPSTFENPPTSTGLGKG